jgi:PAS domain S-box-containing protein
MARILLRMLFWAVILMVYTSTGTEHAYGSHLQQTIFAGFPIDQNQTPRTLGGDAAEVEETDQASGSRSMVETYTRWFVIVILTLSLLTLILAISKLLNQRKVNRILSHQKLILRKTLQDQKISEEKYKALFSQANDSIFIMDHETFIDCNDKTLEMFGCERDEIIGHPPYEFSPRLQPDGKKSKDKALHLIRECHDGNPQRFYWEHTKKDGTPFDAEVSLNMIILEDKPYIQAIVRNISERVRAEKAMVKARENAEKATESKTFFLAKMSHEIRTMLGGITSSVQLLSNTRLNKQQSEYLEIINTSADNLLSIVNEILDLSKIEAGKIDIESKPFDLGKKLESIVNAHLSRAKDKNLSLYLGLHPKIPQYVEGDELRLNQIISNLLSNAIKFTDEGSVSLDASPVEEKNDHHKISFKVSDTGIGIPENRIKDMFSEYSQSDASISRRFGGTGLGLSIVYQLTKLMGGSIDVKSELNKGTQFEIRIDFKKAASPGPEAKGMKKHIGKNNNKYRIMLAEDNIINQKITIINLRELGHDVDLAVNGTEAWEKYQEKDYDIILMDIQMPEMDGLEVTRLIREHEAQHPGRGKTRIVALTANILGQDAEYCLSEGMDAYVSKPFRIEDILEKLEPETPAP